MHSDDFYKAINALEQALGNGVAIELDNGGQIVIYTDLMWGDCDDVVPYVEEDEND